MRAIDALDRAAHANPDTYFAVQGDEAVSNADREPFLAQGVHALVDMAHIADRGHPVAGAPGSLPAGEVTRVPGQQGAGRLHGPHLSARGGTASARRQENQRVHAAFEEYRRGNHRYL